MGILGIDQSQKQIMETKNNKEQQREPKKTLQLTSLLELQIGINKENSSKQAINQSIKQASK